MKFYIALRYRYNFNILEKDITMSLQCQHVIGTMKIQQKTDVATISGAHWDIGSHFIKVLNKKVSYSISNLLVNENNQFCFMILV